MARLAVIGGSGLAGLAQLGEAIPFVPQTTPWGDPSAIFSMAGQGDDAVLFVARHGPGHSVPPHQVNYRANIAAIKSAGAEEIISISAVGGLVEEAAPGTIVFVDQFIDRTVSRQATYFEDGVVAHVSMADPACRSLRERLVASATDVGLDYLSKGTYLAMEGPQFSSRAESMMYRSWGATVIGMTNMPEARLAREAEICYQTVALVTDYDAWRPHEDAVSVEAVLQVLKENAQKARQLLNAFFSSHHHGQCQAGCRQALDYAMITDPQQIDDATKMRLSQIAPRKFS